MEKIQMELSFSMETNIFILNMENTLSNGCEKGSMVSLIFIFPFKKKLKMNNNSHNLKIQRLFNPKVQRTIK